jgi:hypothetical protein
MEITTTNICGNWLIVVMNDLGEIIASFDLQDEASAYSFFLSQLNSEELAAEQARVAAVESGWILAAEDAANRQLSYCN